MKPHRSEGERGVALLMALFAMMLLSAIAIGLMYMSDTETSINLNYREQQRAFFAAQAGLAEVRERMTVSNTGAHRITGPAGLPPMAGSVIYVTNPATGETVTPNVPGSRYFDTQLCHENLSGLGMTNPGPGKQCTTAASSPGVYAPFLASDAPFNSSAAALEYKWVRITAKANRTGDPYYVDGGANAGTYDTQVCFDGLNEKVLPAGYATCSSDPPPPQFMYMRPVYVLTALAVTRTGARRMVQMEVAEQPPMITNAAVDSQDHVSLSGQLTVNGYDQCSCLCTTTVVKGVKKTDCVDRPGKICDKSKWAIYSSQTVDNPNSSETVIAGPDPPIAQNQPWFYDIPSMVETFGGNPTAVNVTGPPYNYTCSGSPADCGTHPDQQFGGLPSPFPPADPSNPIGVVNQITYVPGDLKLTNAASGAGILVVDGDLEINGGLQFYGLILVKGVVAFTGGGANPTNIVGAVLAGQQSLDNTVLGGSAVINYDLCALQQKQAPQPPTIIAYREVHY
ncbi:MAG TPA: pilus assembly PilX N-terminal domain-containing protein [Terriglobales bacterium]|nr:pilus assembly PilX N-terminal domain-containing protein [Terriglobales bacterium]